MKKTNKDEIRLAAIDTSLRLFNERGYRGVTMDDIASSMRISKRTLYEVFRDKEQLLTECLERIHENIDTLHKRIYNSVNEPLLVALYMIRVNAMTNYKYCHLLEEIERYRPALYDRFAQIRSERFRSMLQKSLRYGVDNGYLRPSADIEVAVEFISLMVQKRRLSGATDSDRFVKMLNDVIFTYLRGLMTVDAIRRYEQQEASYHQIIDNLTAEANESLGNLQ